MPRGWMHTPRLLTPPASAAGRSTGWHRWVSPAARRCGRGWDPPIRRMD